MSSIRDKFGTPFPRWNFSIKSRTIESDLFKIDIPIDISVGPTDDNDNIKLFTPGIYYKPEDVPRHPIYALLVEPPSLDLLGAVDDKGGDHGCLEWGVVGEYARGSTAGSSALHHDTRNRD